MVARSKGGRKTPVRVVELLRAEVEKTSQAATARATGLTLRGVQNYLKGIGDPTTTTLEKLSKHFGVTVAWLRGEEYSPAIVTLAENLSMDLEDVQKHMHVFGWNEKDEKKWNTRDMTKFFKKLSLPEQKNVAWIANFLVRLDLEHQQHLITSVMRHYGHLCRSLPGDTGEE